MFFLPFANNRDSMVRLTVREKTTDIDAESINVAAHHIGEVLIDMRSGLVTELKLVSSHSDRGWNWLSIEIIWFENSGNGSWSGRGGGTSRI
jgi:hypothetical protein